MSQAYSDKSRESDPHALPDVEVFYFNGDGRAMPCMIDGDGAIADFGWYYWFCSPGCLPDSEPTGPFKTKQEALDDAQQDSDGLDPAPKFDGF